MFSAINSKTNKLVDAMIIEIDPSYLLYKEDIWYADPLDIKEYDKSKVSDITKIDVKFRHGCTDKMSPKGNFFDVIPHFYIPNKEILGIKTEPESKEHLLAKTFLYKLAKQNQLKFIYSNHGKNDKKDNILILEKNNIDFEGISIEEPIRNNRRQEVDIFIPFKKSDILFGNGICIEIQFSNQYRSTTEKRTIELAVKGYSVCWLFDYDILFGEDNEVVIKESLLKLHPMATIISQWYEDAKRNMLWITEEHSRKIDKKIEDFNKEFNEKMNYMLSFIKTIENMVERIEKPLISGKCPKCNEGMLIKRKSKMSHSEFYGCSRYPDCYFTVGIN